MFKRSQSDFLFATPSFASGVARTIDLAGTFDEYNSTENPDAVAIASDWYVVGSDLQSALEVEGALEALASSR